MSELSFDALPERKYIRRSTISVPWEEGTVLEENENTWTRVDSGAMQVCIMYIVAAATMATGSGLPFPILNAIYQFHVRHEGRPR